MEDVGQLQEKALHYDAARDGNFSEWLRDQQDGGWSLVPNTGGYGIPYIFQRKRIGPPR